MEYQKKSVNIKGYEMYQCDTEGVVYGKNGKPLKPNINKRGYKYVVFCVNGRTKTVQVHRIIALTFVPNPNNYDIVNHLDGNKLNNKASNFEWTTHHGNVEHAKHILHSYKSGLDNHNTKPIQAFDKTTNELRYEFISLAEASQYFAPVDSSYQKLRHIQNVISQVANRRKGRKTYKGYIWQYKE